MQIHYNLLTGSTPDQSAAKLRIADDDGKYNYLRTTLLPAPVELPCRAGVANKLCNRDDAMADNAARFGLESKLADLLHLLCGARPSVRPELHPPGQPAHGRAGRGGPHAPARPLHLRRRRQGAAQREDASRHHQLGLRQPGVDPASGAR